MKFNKNPCYVLVNIIYLNSNVYEKNSMTVVHLAWNSVCRLHFNNYRKNRVSKFINNKEICTKLQQIFIVISAHVLW